MGSALDEKSRWSGLVIAAVAVVAYALANVAHEGAHGVACVVVGGKPLAFSAIYFDCDKEGVAPGLLKWIPAAGTLTNLLLALCALVALRVLRREASTARYFTWLFFTVNALQAGGYWLFSGLGNIGDWARVIEGLSPHGLWRAVLAVGGGLFYLGVIRYALGELCVFLDPTGPVVAQARRLTLWPYLVGGVLYVGAGLLNPLGFLLVLISAAAASFGGTSALAWMFNLANLPRVGRPSAARPFVPSGTAGWLLGALVVAAAFIFVLGPAVTF